MSTMPVTESPHTIAARDLLQRIRAVQDLTGAKTLLQANKRKRLNATSGIPDEFIEAAAVVLEAYDKLAAVSDTTAAELRDVVAFSRAYSPVVDELLLAAKVLQHEIASRRSFAGKQSLKTYALVKDFNRPNDEAMLVPHIEAMKRLLGRSGITTKAPAPPAPAPPPVPAPAPAPEPGKPNKP